MTAEIRPYRNAARVVRRAALNPIQAWASKANISDLAIISIYQTAYDNLVSANLWNSIKSVQAATTDIWSVGMNAEKLAQMRVNMANIDVDHTFISNPTASIAGLQFNGTDQATDCNLSASAMGLNISDFCRTTIYNNTFTETAAQQVWGFQDVSGSNAYLIQVFNNYCCGGLFIWIGTGWGTSQYRFTNAVASSRGIYNLRMIGGVKNVYLNNVLKSNTYAGGTNVQTQPFPNLTFTLACAKTSANVLLANAPIKVSLDIFHNALSLSQQTIFNNIWLQVQSSLETYFSLPTNTRR